jgi:hypothetical protein
MRNKRERDKCGQIAWVMVRETSPHSGALITSRILCFHLAIPASHPPSRPEGIITQSFQDYLLFGCHVRVTGLNKTQVPFIPLLRRILEDATLRTYQQLGYIVSSVGLTDELKGLERNPAFGWRDRGKSRKLSQDKRFPSASRIPVCVECCRCPRMLSAIWLLWTRKWTCGFHKTNQANFSFS